MKKTSMATGMAMALLVVTGNPSSLQAGPAKACYHEISAHCGSMSGHVRIEACVRANFRKLSANCQAVVVKTKPVASACRADLARYCGHVKGGLMRLGLCLHSNSGKFSSQCRATFSKVAAGYR